MKKIVLLFAVLIAANLNCTAQQNLSMRAGYSVPIGNINQRDKNIHSISIGANYDFKLTDELSVRPGLYYLMQWQTSDKIGEVGVELAKSISNSDKVTADSRYHSFYNHITIPLMAAWQKNNFDYEIGPYIATEIATRNSIGGRKYDSNYDYKKCSSFNASSHTARSSPN